MSLDFEDYFAAGSFGFHVAVGFGYLSEWEGAVDYDSEAAGIDLLAEPVELAAAGFDDHELCSFATNECSSDVFEDARAWDRLDVGPARGEQVFHLVEVVVAEDIEDGVELLIEID